MRNGRTCTLRPHTFVLVHSVDMDRAGADPGVTCFVGGCSVQVRFLGQPRRHSIVYRRRRGGSFSGGSRIDLLVGRW